MGVLLCRTIWLTRPDAHPKLLSRMKGLGFNFWRKIRWPRTKGLAPSGSPGLGGARREPETSSSFTRTGAREARFKNLKAIEYGGFIRSR